MTENDDESCAEPFRRKLDTADLRRGDDVSGNTDHEQVSEALIEDGLDRHSRIGATEDHRERLLTRKRLHALDSAHRRVTALVAGKKAVVAFAQPLECV
jgi:hypothetical protein